jgi:hypothetical protein
MIACVSGAGAKIFRHALPLLLCGEDPQFKSYLRRIAEEERGATIQLS